MRSLSIAIAALALCVSPAAAQSRKIDLRTTEGVKSLRGAWKYHDVKIVEIDAKGPNGAPIKTYAIEPKAGVANYDDSKWETIAPETLKDRRSTGRVCFCWYRIKLTLPDGVEGKKVVFSTTVDDYGEVWVDGQLPRKGGQSGGSIVAGFNAPNRVELANPKPGKTYEIAVFGINGPISAEPTNYIFLGATFLEISDR